VKEKEDWKKIHWGKSKKGRNRKPGSGKWVLSKKTKITRKWPLT